MNKINEKLNCQTRLCESAASRDWTCNSPRAGAKIFARRIGEAMQMAHVQKNGTDTRMNAPRSFVGGRSMIEMLGVLAIIGVLTIGGLMGYRYAMNKHKANLILNDVSLAMADLTVQDPDGGAIARQAVAFNPESGLAMESERTEDGNNIVYVNGVAKAVCQILIQIKPTEAYENIYDEHLNTLTSCSDNQTMAFGSKDSDVPPVTKECNTNADCAADQVCQNGHCVAKPKPTDPCDPNPCSNGGICSNGECTCINGFTGKYCDDAPECIVDEQCDVLQFCKNYVCVCQNLEGCMTQDKDTCKCDKCDTAYIKKDGECEKCTAPKVPNADQTACECPKIAGCLTQNADTCACDKCDTAYIKKDGKCEKCTAPKVPNADQTACECPKIANCKEYNDSTCECNKCEDGFEVVDGKCVEVSRCAADAPVQCGTSCCPENSTCDGDKCCLGGTCCDAGLAPTACYDMPKEVEEHGITRTPSYYCIGEIRSYDEACQLAKELYKKSGTKEYVATGLFKRETSVYNTLVSSSDGETCEDGGTAGGVCYD